MRCYSLHVHQHRSYTYLYLKSRERLTRTPRHFITPQLACMYTLIHTHTHANASCRRACTTSTWHNHGRRYLRSAAPRELCVSSALWARLSDVPRAPPWAQRRLWVSPHRPMPPPPYSIGMRLRRGACGHRHQAGCSHDSAGVTSVATTLASAWRARRCRRVWRSPGSCRHYPPPRTTPHRKSTGASGKGGEGGLRCVGGVGTGRASRSHRWTRPHALSDRLTRSERRLRARHIPGRRCRSKCPSQFGSTLISTRDWSARSLACCWTVRR